MPEDRLVGGFDIDTYTSAPLRISRAAVLEAPPLRVFTWISDHAELDRWIPLVGPVNVVRGHADSPNGVGTIRYLHVGPYTLRQYVIAYDPPRLLAYSIEQDPLFADHVGLLYLQGERYGGTQLTWQHYYRLELLPWLTDGPVALALDLVVRAALLRLVDQFGGRLC